MSETMDRSAGVAGAPVGGIRWGCLPASQAPGRPPAARGRYLTVKVKAWLTGPTALVAVIVIGKVPLARGVPERLAVPLWLSVKVTPDGRLPVSTSDGTG